MTKKSDGAANFYKVVINKSLFDRYSLYSIGVFEKGGTKRMNFFWKTYRKLFARSIIINVNVFEFFTTASFVIMIAKTSHLINFAIGIPRFVMIRAYFSPYIRFRWTCWHTNAFGFTVNDIAYFSSAASFGCTQIFKNLIKKIRFEMN